METLAHLFDWLLTASARASLLSLVVIGLQVLLRHRVPARWRYALWLPVLLVLLTPAFPESQWSVGSIVRNESSPLPVPEMVAQEPALNVTPSAVEAAETPAPISWIQIMRLAWLPGAAGMIVICLGSYTLTLWRIKHDRVPVSDALRQEITALAREIGLRRAPRVWMSSEIRSPAVTGLLHPRLLLPVPFEQTLTAREARLVLRHELTHLKRGDLPLNALLCLLLALHWFNPLLWLAFFKVRLDREAACDAQVLDQEPQAERVAYGHTLLKVESTFGHHGLSLGFVGIFQRGSALRSRIQSIAKPPTQTVTMKTTLSLGIALLTFLGITKAAPPDKNAPQVLIETKYIEYAPGMTDLLDSFAPTSAVPSVSALLNDEQLSALWKKIETDPRVNVLSMPSLTTQSGREATIVLEREFAYKDADGKPATKQLGPMLSVLATKIRENDIKLEVSPQIVMREGILKIEKGKPTNFENHVPPVFKELAPRVSISISMISGQTAVLGLPAASSKYTLEQRTGETVTRETKEATREMFFFVTARLVDSATDTPVDPETAAIRRNEEKLKSILLPSVDFADVPFSDAIEFLRQRSIELDVNEPDVTRKGVNILIDAGPAAGGMGDTRISLRLANVPLAEALRYTSSLAQMKFRVYPFAVKVIPIDPPPTQKGNPQESISVEKAEIRPQTRPEPTAGTIILPTVQFQDATLTEAVEFLRIKSRELDPGKKGLNILVKPGGDPTASITMQFKNVPASEALRYVAELAGCTLTVEGDGFVITPLQGDR